MKTSVSERDNMIAHEKRLQDAANALETIGKHGWARKLRKEARQINRWLDTADRG